MCVYIMYIHVCIHTHTHTHAHKHTHSVSLYNPSWPKTHYVDQVGLKLLETQLPLPPYIWLSIDK